MQSLLSFYFIRGIMFNVYLYLLSGLADLLISLCTMRFVV